MFSLMRNIGSSIGISVVVTLLAQNTQINHAALAEYADPVPRPATQLSGCRALWDWATAAGARGAQRRGHAPGRDHRLYQRLPADDVGDAAGRAPVLLLRVQREGEAGPTPVID